MTEPIRSLDPGQVLVRSPASLAANHLAERPAATHVDGRTRRHSH